MAEKLCVFCKYFEWGEFEYAYYSTWTGGELFGGMTCLKSIYSARNPRDTDDFRQTILLAEACEHYSPPK